MTSIASLITAYDPRRALERAETPPKAWYVDPRIAEYERGSVFARHWQVVGRIDQVASPGDYLTADVAGEPVVVVRGRDGVLRAFFNVCRHHAAIVMPQPCGTATAMKCPYHGWTYGLDGKLVSCGEFEEVRDFEKSRSGLVPLAVDTWEQFVFVRMDSGDAPATAASPALREYLGEMATRAAPLRLGELRFVERRSWDLKCNWKVFVDNYLDGGYHVPHAHPALGSVLDYAEYRIECFQRSALQSSPLDSSSATDAEAAATRRGAMAHYFWLYPNFMLNWYEGYMDTNLVLPLGVDGCRVIFDFFFADPAAGTDTAAAEQARSIAMAARVQDEDIDVCESVQRGLSSRSYETGRLSVRREAGEHLFHRLLHADLSAGLL